MLLNFSKRNDKLLVEFHCKLQCFSTNICSQSFEELLFQFWYGKISFELQTACKTQQFSLVPLEILLSVLSNTKKKKNCWYSV